MKVCFHNVLSCAAVCLLGLQFLSFVSCDTSFAAQAQEKAVKPISLDGLLKALKLKALEPTEFVKAIEKRGVSFEVTADVEKQLRLAGANSDIILAARDNYRGAPLPAQNPQPDTKKVPEKPAEAPLLVKCDLPCTWKLDDESQGDIAGGGSRRIAVSFGQHLVEASTIDGADKAEKIVESQSSGQSVVIFQLAPVREARLKAEQEVKDKAARDEAARARTLPPSPVVPKHEEGGVEANRGTPVRQFTETMGRIHGQVTNPTGTAQAGGSVDLSADSGRTSLYTFPVDASGRYEGEAAPGVYFALYRQANMPSDKMADSFQGVAIRAGQDVLQDFDMSRAEFVEKLSPEQRRALEDLRQKNLSAMKTNEVIRNLNADLSRAAQDFKDADSARGIALQELGSTASKTDIDARTAEIRSAKYGEAEALMLKDTAVKPDASILWAQLGQAQLGLKKFGEAEAAYGKALDAEAASKKPNSQIQGAIRMGLGEIYARTGRVADAAAAYDAAAQANPAAAGLYFRNESTVFSQLGNKNAQADAADKAIQADPNNSTAYYLKGQALIASATIDSRTNKIVVPPGCREAYLKYLELAPSGPYAAEVNSILKTLR
jgi:tetratricopeptide (TPR) repeat protein